MNGIGGGRPNTWPVGAFAVAVTILTLGFVWTLSADQARDEIRAAQSAYTYAASADAQVEQRCMAMPRKEMLACVSKAVEAARENQRSEQELVAQQSSARWTAVAGGAAGLGFIVSLVGIALVWTTFRETRRSNIIAREMGEAQIRCYINITGAGIQFLGPDRILIGTDIKNGGQSPARNVRINARAKIVGGAIEKVISGIPAMQNSHPICVGDTMHPNALYVIDPAFTAEEITYLQANPYTIELVIAASCIDVFNVEVGTIASFNNPASFLRGDLTASELVPLARSAEKSEWQEQQTELSEKTTPPPLS